MTFARSLLCPFTAALYAMLWLPACQAQTCVQPGPLALTYAAEAASHPLDDAIGVGKRVHAYQFMMSQSKKLCSIGYEAPSSAPVSYTFRLYDCSSGVSVPVPGANLTVAGSTFSPGLQYAPVSPAWPLLAGTCYEIRRHVTGPATALQRQGRRLDNETTYPINAVPSISILGTNFFNTPTSTQTPNAYLPFIDFGTR